MTPQKETAYYVTSNRRSAMGKSTVDITCGFCGRTVTAYIWSLAGGGKRCPCGALHNSHGTSTRKRQS